MIRLRDAWLIGRQLYGHDLNGELASVSDEFRPIAERLATLVTGNRMATWETFLLGRPDREKVIEALAAIDPSGPAPEEEHEERFATAADIRRLMSTTPFLWEPWIPAKRIFGLAGEEGAGKTRTALDIHRRVYLGLDWPDGKKATPGLAGRPAIWLCSDGHQDELAEILPEYSLPDQSIVFPASPEEPYEGTDLDVPELLEPGGVIERAIIAVNPWCFFIDTLTYATARNLCDQHVMKSLKTPLHRLVQSRDMCIGLLLHLSREGTVLGRRIRGLTRVLMKLECPNPDPDSDNQPQKLRLSVPKSYFKKPPPLGVTLGSNGVEYDLEPPPPVGPVAQAPRGRPATARNEAQQFILLALARAGDSELIYNDLKREWKETGKNVKAFGCALDELEKKGAIVRDHGPGSGQQMTITLANKAQVKPAPNPDDADPDDVF